MRLSSRGVAQMTTLKSHSRRDLVAELRRAAPPGLASLGPTTLAQLEQVTSELIAGASPEVLAAAERFERERERALPDDRGHLRSGIVGRVVLVTGGTGCIGSALLRELADLGAERLV